MPKNAKNKAGSSGRQTPGSSGRQPPSSSGRQTGDAKPTTKLDAHLPVRLALLRGINVGGKNKLPMKDLSEMFEASGCLQVQTFIQSGNVIFQAPDALAAKLPGLIAAQIADRFGYQIPVVLRTHAQLQDALRHNPFLPASAEETLHLMFLSTQPDPARIAALDPLRSHPDQFIVRGHDIYLKLPNGVANSKLTNAYFDSKLGLVSTMRNWKTVTKLTELMAPQS